MTSNFSTSRFFFACFGIACLSGLTIPGPALGAQAYQATIDSATVELERGRSWHAARLLRAQPDPSGFSPDEVLLLARAESGFKGFEGVLDALRGQSWLAELNDAEGLYLLGVAEFELGDWEESARLLAEYETSTMRADRRAVARSRLARVQAENGAFDEALRTMGRMEQDPEQLRAWTALEVARTAARHPDVEAVRRASGHATGEPHLRTWALEPEALIEQGDSLGAEGVYRDRLEGLEANSRRGWALMSLGQLAFARGDEEAAGTAFEASLDAFGRGTSGVRAAGGLLRIGVDDAELARRLARVLSSGGDARLSVQAWERYFELVEVEPSPADRFSWARQLSRLDRHEDAVVAFREIETADDPDLVLRVLDSWVDVRRAQGRRDAVRTIQGWILERFPQSAQAAEIHFFRGDDLHDRGVLGDAAAHYERAMSTGPHSIAGLSWMRAGQIADGLGQPEQAAEVYERYLNEYPEGRRWDQAAYWSGRSRADMGDSLTARRRWESILTRFPTSYYAMLAATELGRTYDVELTEPLEESVPSEALLQNLRTLDLLVDADLEDAVAWWIARLRERTEGVDDRMVLAESLTERGFTVEGIRTGQAMLSGGMKLDRRLLKIIYPFPFRSVIMAEAAERNVDPFLLAGLIRQESAFDADVVSRAGAIGLMQVMPNTGGALARAERIRGFTTESLETAEINVHLGVNFWTDLERAFSGTHIPLRLSAYNAGPTRARRWRQLPEMSDPLRFTERIPFEETRGYVKNVSRNAALYRALYGTSNPAPAEGGGSR